MHGSLAHRRPNPGGGAPHLVDVLHRELHRAVDLRLGREAPQAKADRGVGLRRWCGPGGVRGWRGGVWEGKGGRSRALRWQVQGEQQTQPPSALTMSSSTPSARSTYDGSRLALVQALPLDTATSCVGVVVRLGGRGGRAQRRGGRQGTGREDRELGSPAPHKALLCSRAASHLITPSHPPTSSPHTAAAAAGAP